MAAVWFRLRAELRSRWRAWLALAVLAGVAGRPRHRHRCGGAAHGQHRRALAGRHPEFRRLGREQQGVRGGGGLRASRAAAGSRRRRPLRRPRVLGPHRRRPPGNGQRDRAERAGRGPRLLCEPAEAARGQAPGPDRADEIFVDSAAAERLRPAGWEHGAGAVRDAARACAASSRPASTTRVPTPQARAVGRCSGCASSGFAPSSNLEDALPLITMSPAFYETYGRRVGIMDRVHRNPARAGRRGPGRLQGRGRADSGRRAGRASTRNEDPRVETGAIDPSAGAGAVGARGARRRSPRCFSSGRRWRARPLSSRARIRCCDRSG